MEDLFVDFGPELLTHSCNQCSWRLHWRSHTALQRVYPLLKGEAYQPQGDRLKAINLISKNALPDADQMLQQLLDRSKIEKGSQHPLTFALNGDLGRLRIKQRRFAEAEALLRECLLGIGNEFGFYHPKTLDHALQLGILFQDQERFHKSVQIYSSIIAGLELSQKFNPYSAAVAFARLGQVLSKEDRFAESERAYQQAQKWYEHLEDQQSPVAQSVILSRVLSQLMLAKLAGREGKMDEESSKHTEAHILSKQLRDTSEVIASMALKLSEK